MIDDGRRKFNSDPADEILVRALKRQPLTECVSVEKLLEARLQNPHQPEMPGANQGHLWVGQRLKKLPYRVGRRAHGLQQSVFFQLSPKGIAQLRASQERPLPLALRDNLSIMLIFYKSQKALIPLRLLFELTPRRRRDEDAKKLTTALILKSSSRSNFKSGMASPCGIRGAMMSIKWHSNGNQLAVKDLAGFS